MLSLTTVASFICASLGSPIIPIFLFFLIPSTPTGGGSIFFGCLIIASLQALLVHCVKGLVQSSDIITHCPGSILDIYTVASLILFLVSGSILLRFSKSKASILFCAWTTSFAISTVTAIWGFAEIYNKSCSELDDSLLRTMATILLAIHTTISLVGVLMIFCLFV